MKIKILILIYKIIKKNKNININIIKLIEIKINKWNVKILPLIEGQ